MRLRYLSKRIWDNSHLLYQIRLGKYIIVKARQEAGGRRQEKNNYGIKTGFSIRSSLIHYKLVK